MRFVAGCAAIAVMACTPASWHPAPKRIRPPKTGGVPIDLYCAKEDECTGKVRGVVSVRGGDAVDWYTVTIPSSSCTERLRLALRWEIPREGSQLALSLWYPGRGKILKTMYQRESEDDEDDDDEEVPGRGFIAIDNGYVEHGTYLIGVHARKDIGAGAYTLDVTERSSCWGLPTRDVIQIRPETIAAPNTPTPLVSITSAGMSRTSTLDFPANVPTLVLDASDPRVAIGARGVLVNQRGKRVRHGEFEITDVWSPEGSDTRFASARFVRPGWFRRKIESGWNYWFASFDSVTAQVKHRK